jgi:hypothetical protein
VEYVLKATDLRMRQQPALLVMTIDLQNTVRINRIDFDDTVAFLKWHRLFDAWVRLDSFPVFEAKPCRQNVAAWIVGVFGFRASREVCPKHRKSRRETAGW